MENQIEKLMRVLDVSREEAEEIVKSDKEVDKMKSAKEINSDLTEEQRKVVKKSTSVGTKKHTVYKFDTTKSRKVDNEKADFITKLAEFVKENGENVEIVKSEREISFTIGENSYSLTLIKHRK